MTIKRLRFNYRYLTEIQPLNQKSSNDRALLITFHCHISRESKSIQVLLERKTDGTYHRCSRRRDFDKEIKVLDHGFVDWSIIWVVMHALFKPRESHTAKAPRPGEDAGLIDYLLRHEHTSPFEHVVFEFHAKMPILLRASGFVTARPDSMKYRDATPSSKTSSMYLNHNT